MMYLRVFVLIFLAYSVLGADNCGTLDNGKLLICKAITTTSKSCSLLNKRLACSKRMDCTEAIAYVKETRAEMKKIDCKEKSAAGFAAPSFVLMVVLAALLKFSN